MEKKKLSQEELKEKIWEQNQAKGFNASSKGRSAAQGIKLLLIRDYLRKHTDKEHPKNAKDIVEYLATQGIKAERKTIYNDILRLQIDLQEPIEYNPKKWGYYVTQPQFETKDLRMLIDCVQLSPLVTERESHALSQKILELGTIYSKELLEKHVNKRIDLNRPEDSVFQKVEILRQAIASNKKIRCCITSPILERGIQSNQTANADDYYIVSPKEIRIRNGLYYLVVFPDDRCEYNYGVFLDRMSDIKILSLDSERKDGCPIDFEPSKPVLIDREQYSFDPDREYAVTILLRQFDMKLVKRRFGNDIPLIPYDDENMMITIHTKLSHIFFSKIADFGVHAKILSPKEAIGEYFEYIKKGMKDIDELYGYGTPEFLADVPTNYDALRAQQHKFKHTRRIRKRK